MGASASLLILCGDVYNGRHYFHSHLGLFGFGGSLESDGAWAV
jgi:hypothetical protein